MKIVGECCILSGNRILFKLGRYGKISINLFLLHRLAGSCFIYKMLCHFKSRYGGNVPDYRPGSSSMILIDNTDRNVFHLSVTKDRSHKEKGEQWQDNADTKIKAP